MNYADYLLKKFFSYKLTKPNDAAVVDQNGKRTTS